MIDKLPMYSMAEIVRSAQIDALGFGDLPEMPREDGLRIVTEFRTGTETLFQKLDKQWVALCDGNTEELIAWASRMRLIRHKWDELDRQLAVAQTPRLFNWETVLLAMGFINAFRVAVEQTLHHNKHAVAA